MNKLIVGLALLGIALWAGRIIWVFNHRDEVSPKRRKSSYIVGGFFIFLNVLMLIIYLESLCS